MAQRKLSRKERALAARIAAERAAARPAVKKDFRTDGSARFSAYLWAAALTVGYGIVNNLVLGRPEQRVDGEALVVCAATLVIHLLVYYREPARATMLNRVAKPLWNVIQRMEKPRYSRIAGLTILLTVFVFAATPIGNIEPALAAKHLAKSDIGLVPGLDDGLQGTEPAYRFREISNRIEKTIQERKPTDPSTLSEVRDSLAKIVENVRLPEDVSVAAKLELAYLETYEALSKIGVADPGALNQISSGFVPGVPTVIGEGPDKTKFFMIPPSSSLRLLCRNYLTSLIFIFNRVRATL
jgi:hypothetical protein